MRIRTVTMSAAVLLLAVTGCSSDSEPEPAVKAKPTPTAVSKDSQFLAAVDKASITSWTTTGPTDAELLDYPQRWCDSLAAGHSADYVLTADKGLLYPLGEDWGTQRDEANELLVLGAKTYCPDLADQVTDDLRATGDY